MEQLPSPPTSNAGVVVCDDTLNSCRCTLDAGHYPQTPHLCDSDDCGGSWSYDNDGKLIVHRFPGDVFVFYDESALFSDAIAAYEQVVKSVRESPLFAIGQLTRSIRRTTISVAEIGRLFQVPARLIADPARLRYERAFLRARARSQAADTSRRKRKHGRR